MGSRIMFIPCFGYTPNVNLKFQVACAVMRPLGFMLVDYRNTLYRLKLPELKSKKKNIIF